MRLPRHDTSLSLSAEPPAEALSADEALLSATASVGLVRWWLATAPAIVVGLGLHHRLPEIVDVDRARNAGVEVLARRAGGGAVLVDDHMLCGALSLPTASLSPDVTESYRWLGDAIVGGLREIGVDARRVDPAEARADIGTLRRRDDRVAAVLLTTCYGALSPHEVVADGSRKLVGLAQIRRRDITLFQFGILLRDQSALARYLLVKDDLSRDAVADALRERTVGLERLTDRSAGAVVAAIADAMPCAP